MKDNSIICSVNLRHTLHADLKLLVCGNVVAHFVIVELLVCDHIKVACACKTEEVVFSSPVSLHFIASSIATLIAWLLSGAGRIPSVLANCSAAANTLVCSTERAVIYPSW